MRVHHLRLFCLSCLLFSLLTASHLKAEDQIRLSQAFKNLHFGMQRPIMIAVPEGRNETYLLTQRGKIYLLPKEAGAKQAEVFLDFSNRKMESHKFEEGLLGLAFHPKYQKNRRLYVTYSQQHPKRTVLSELKATANFKEVDLASERVLLEIEQPFWNHNSGNLLFGQDGFLYYAVGDGGKANDIRRLAQNPWLFNGKILRLDIDTTSPGRAYGIPNDNPLVGQEGVREEIYALGVRNPWGIHEDKTTGQFIFADVGQNRFEEINLLKKGGNYGWSYREGFEAFELRSDQPPETLNMIDPIHVYGRADGISVTGGLIYQGDQVESLKGRYIFADWGMGNIWSLKIEQGKAIDLKQIWQRPISQNKKKGKKQNKNIGIRPSAFGMDHLGRLLLVSWNGGVYEVMDQE